MRKKILLSFILVLAIVFVGGEVALRKFLGMCHAPLFYASNKYEYMVEPNQSGYRFGHYYFFNAYSQRSANPNYSKPIILGLGDSVLWGGVMVDQNDIATSLFTKETGIQMLNISAGSWGPDNCAAYLKDKGFFHARAMFLVVSSHDSHDNMDFEPVVGKMESYPDKQYKLAWAELIERYIIPRVFPSNKKLDVDEEVNFGIQKNGKIFNPGFTELKNMADSLHIPFIVYLHAETSEVKRKKYNSQGLEIIHWAKLNHVRLIRELNYHLPLSCYRDNIHFNKIGQRLLATIMEKGLKSLDNSIMHQK